MANLLMDPKSLIKAEKTTELLANFIDGFADGWFMAIKESFKMELDIKFTERSKNNVSYFEWTQGPYYCFSEGQLIYDTKEAYNCWKDSLKKVNLACQIIEAKRNLPFKHKNIETDKTEFRVIEGFVKFLLFKPDEGRTKLVPFVCYTLSQNDFVRFLKTGTI
jgi:hypothetical protein